MSHGGQLAAHGICHRFGEVEVLRGIDLEIESGELITLLGPSGCGKTTMLRMVAGFLRAGGGTLTLDGKDLGRVPAHKRPVNMVFQRPTLFPHLDVFDNVAFGLRLARVGKAEVRRRVHEALELVRLGEYGARRNFELSGGQMQRVALARALVNRPKVLLLDEPFSALDLRIRLELEVELRRVHRDTGATFVHVTHDQREALALSDRVAIFHEGRIEQFGSPADVYRTPATPHVARFVGDANVLDVTVSAPNGRGPMARIGATEVAAGSGAPAGPAWLIIRAESVRLQPDPGGGSVPEGLRGIIRDVAFRGASVNYLVDVPGLEDPLKAEVGAADRTAFGVGAPVVIAWDDHATTVLPRQS